MRVNRQLILAGLKGKEVRDFIFMIGTDLSPETVSVWTLFCHSLFICSAWALIQELTLSCLWCILCILPSLHSSSKTFKSQVHIAGPCSRSHAQENNSRVRKSEKVSKLYLKNQKYVIKNLPLKQERSTRDCYFMWRLEVGQSKIGRFEICLIGMHNID